LSLCSLPIASEAILYFHEIHEAGHAIGGDLAAIICNPIASTSRKTKMTLCKKVLVRLVATYASETWTLTKADKRALGLFERKILRSISGAVQDKELWRTRYNFELYKLYGEPDFVKYININRLKWTGHVMQMNNNQITKRMFNTRPEGKRGTGRPKLRWGV
jgi:hypothetical protein